MRGRRRHILAADDDPLARAFVTECLQRQGYRVTCVEDGLQAEEQLKLHGFELLIADLRMPRLDGLGLLKIARQLQPETEVIITTAYGSVEGAVEAVKCGAFDYVTKPFSPERLVILVKRAIERRELRSETERLRDELHKEREAPLIIGRHPRIQEALELARLAADPDATVLIRGESGTGKGLVARFIHSCSRRREHTFVKTSCAAFPESLLEAELFGHERGAFTNAFQRRIGRFEKAHQGTIFLDEIGDLTPTMQIRLLNVLQDRQIERLGSSDPKAVDVKVIAATNRNLEDLMRAGRFREDLYYRLKVVEIILPPLRERVDDIPLLVEHFLLATASRCGRPVPLLPKESLQALMTYSWPGNVRELENAIERAVIVCAGDRIRPQDLSFTAAQPAAGRETGAEDITILDEVEKRTILKALGRAHGNRSAAARLLGIDRTTLQRKIRRYDLQGIQPRPALVRAPSVLSSPDLDNH